MHISLYVYVFYMLDCHDDNDGDDDDGDDHDDDDDDDAKSWCQLTIQSVWNDFKALQ